jgi:hypothetical protein
VQCVVFSACYSEEHARQLVSGGEKAHVPVAFGGVGKLGVQESRTWSMGFYSELCYGASVGAAFEAGNDFVEMQLGKARPDLEFACSDASAKQLSLFGNTALAAVLGSYLSVLLVFCFFFCTIACSFEHITIPKCCSLLWVGLRSIS